MLVAPPPSRCKIARMRHSYHHPSTEVRTSGKEGRGLFATARIRAGEVIVTTGGHLLPFESLASHELPGHPIQVETRLVLSPESVDELDGIFIVNHSCSPNAGMKGQLSLVALRDIHSGEEICFDYAMTDSDPDGRTTFEMDCRCGSPHCRGRVTDMDWRDPELQQKYEGYFSSYLAQRIQSL
jgi:SET domain-containing protein